jgi:hypothetical protein
MWQDLVRALRKVVGLFSAGYEVRARGGFDSAACTSAIPPRTEFIKIEGDAARIVGTIGFEFTTADERLLTPARRDEFKAEVYREASRLAQWAADMDWPAPAQPQLRVLVSDRYKISKSLVPAWYGRAGDMQFPAHRVVSREAAIAHEMAHMLFPNGNRFLAEGLAVYVQAAIGANPAFPNFGKALHDLVRELSATAPADPRVDRICLEQVRLANLDATATPDRLNLRLGEKELLATLTYPIAGSFVQFLIERRGIEKFRALYEETPFQPRTRSGGSPERWTRIYHVTLAELETEWKSMITSGIPTTFAQSAGRQSAGLFVR